MNLREALDTPGFTGSPMRRALVGICFLFVLSVDSRAQGLQLPEPPLPLDPRPIGQLVSAAEKAMLAADASNPKKLVETYLKVSDTHLQAALAAIRSNNAAAAERELDIYNKAIAEAGKLAFGLRDGRRGASKKLEQMLYKQIKTLETIDRLFPAEREAFADAALKHSKLVRVQALNEAFAAGDLLKDPGEQKKPENEPPSKETPKKSSTVPPPLAHQIVQAPVAGSPQRRSLFSRAISLNTSDSIRSSIPLNGRRLNASAQLPGDYLTDEEDSHVREAQAADDRVKVFMKIADRRIKALGGPPAAPTDKKEQKKAEEEEREWGPVPKVTRLELLRHYARAIAECIAKLEDAYERNPKSSAIPKALTMLRDSTERHLQMLRTLTPEVKGDGEEAALRDAISEAETANKGARDGLK